MQQMGQEGDMMEVFGPGHRGYLVLSILIVGILFLTACGGGSSGTGGTQPPAPTVSINASATQIVAGSSSPLTLTVTASNTTQVVISDSCDSQTYTLQTTGGTLTQPIPVPTTPGTCTYTANASGANSQTATNSVAITVQPSMATTVSMTPPQQTVAAGQSATLQVTAANANSVYITNNVTNASIPVPAAGGTVKVTPAPDDDLHGHGDRSQQPAGYGDGYGYDTVGIHHGCSHDDRCRQSHELDRYGRECIASCRSPTTLITTPTRCPAPAAHSLSAQPRPPPTRQQLAVEASLIQRR